MTGPETTPGRENLDPSQDVKRGLISRGELTSRVKGWFNKPLREPAADILARTTLLPDRLVSLADINLREKLHIDSTAAVRLALAVNGIKETPLDAFDINRFKPDKSLYPAIPWVASVIANSQNPEIPVLMPSEEDIAQMKPWLMETSILLGMFSSRLEHWFGRIVETSGAGKVNKKAKNIMKIAQKIGKIDNPRARFVPELAQLYRNLAQDNGTLIEHKITKLVGDLANARMYRTSSPIDESSYPLLATVIALTEFPPQGTSSFEAGIVGSEIMSGMEIFLKRQGERNISTAPEHIEPFDFFDLNTWTGDSIVRSAAETFAGERIRAVNRNLPSILIEVLNLLPENGPEIMNTIRILAENVLILSKQGVSNAEIAAALFRKPEGPMKTSTTIPKPPTAPPASRAIPALPTSHSNLREKITQSPNRLSSKKYPPPAKPIG